MTPIGKIHALLATARIANVPSVASNVTLGVALAVVSGPIPWTFSLVIPWALLVGVGVLLYLSGNFFNDWMDREWDAIHRPERALPSRLFTARQYRAVAVGTAVAAVALAGWVAPAGAAAAVVILISIGIYTRWHKSAAWAVIPMGLCRAGLVFLGAWGIAGAFQSEHSSLLLVPHALALLIYIAALSLSARYETQANPPASALAISRSLLLASGLLMAASWITQAPLTVVIGLSAFGIWIGLCLTRFRTPVPVHVSALLAGIPLLDWIAMLPIAMVAHSAGAPTAMVAACVLISPLAAFVGRALQRVASAT